MKKSIAVLMVSLLAIAAIESSGRHSNLLPSIGEKIVDAELVYHRLWVEWMNANTKR